jgi:hypothetical protein
MRMWMLNPELPCNRHLLGEHAELHKFKPSFEKKHNMKTRIERRQIFPSVMKERHDRIAEEMTRRGMNHNSPYTMPDISYIGIMNELTGHDIENNIKDLCGRCPECRERILKYKKWYI